MLILLDTREGIDVEGQLRNTPGVEVIRATLSCGDLLLPTQQVLIERKTAADLLSSIRDGRLAEQVVRLAESSVRFPLLLVHGSLLPAKDWMVIADGQTTGMSYWSVQMALLSVQAAGVYVTIVPDRAFVQTVLHVAAWATKKGHFTAARRQPLDVRLWRPDRRVVALTSFTSHIGRAAALLEHFGTVETALKHVEQWESVKGIGKATVEQAVRILRTPIHQDTVDRPTETTKDLAEEVSYENL